MKVLFALLFVTPLLGQNIPSYSPTYGLDTWYSFANNTTDNSGNNHNGVPHNITPSIGRSGQPNEGYYFNGQNSYIKINNPILNGGNKDKFAFYVSFKLDEVPGGSYPIWFKQFPQADVILVIGTNYHIQLGYETTDTSSSISSAETIELGQWYDIVVNFENSQFQIYINAEPAFVHHQAEPSNSSLPISYNDVDNHCNFVSNSFGSEIGRAGVNRFKGVIDEFGVWNRPLSLCEIQSLHFLEKQCIIEPIGPLNPINNNIFIDNTVIYDEVINDITPAYSVIDSVDVIDIVNDTTLVTVFQEGPMFYAPDAFTPDGNEFNQTWGLVFTDGFNPCEFELLIYNRWGETIYKSNDMHSKWDGTYNNVKCSDGVYIWEMMYKNHFNSEKSITLGSVNLIK
jgi:gliding motility-associated-like protein